MSNLTGRAGGFLRRECPDDDTLRAFALGDLSIQAIEAIGQHLADCSNCRERLPGLETPGDALVEYLRAEKRARSEDAELRTLLARAGQIPIGSWQDWCPPRRIGPGLAAMPRAITASSMRMAQPYSRAPISRAGRPCRLQEVGDHRPLRAPLPAPLPQHAVQSPATLWGGVWGLVVLHIFERAPELAGASPLPRHVATNSLNHRI